MSGGHFDYSQYQISQISDNIAEIIRDNKFPNEILSKMKIAVYHLDMGFIYAHRIDWLMSGDDGEETFLKRIDEDIEKYRRYNQPKYDYECIRKAAKAAYNAQDRNFQTSIPFEELSPYWTQYWNDIAKAVLNSQAE